MPLPIKKYLKLLKKDELWLGTTGFNKGMYFKVPDNFTYADSYKFERECNGIKVSRVAGVCWFTNLYINKCHKELVLYKTYKGNESDYPYYDNYDVINVNKVKDIPLDYTGAMGVPITFLDKYNPEQFEIIGNYNCPFLNKKPIYKRIIIKKR